MEFNLSKLTPDVRKLNDMREVLYDKDFAKNSPDMDAYYMYRKLKIENDLKYNITVITAKMLGEEFMKTKGHIHIGNFSEIYHVLEGEAIFLLQKTKDNVVEDVYAVKTKKGEAIILPGGYGHVTINPLTSIDLKTEDWTSINCNSDYSLFEKLRGACYYYVKGPASAEGFGEGTWIKNENYKNIPELRFEQPLKKVPQDLEFLKKG